MKLQYTLILIFTGLMALILLGINLVMYSMSSGYRRHNFFLSLEDSSRIIASAVLKEEKAQDYYEVKNNIMQHLPNEKEYILKIDKNAAELNFPATPLPLNESFYRDAMTNGSARYYNNGVAYVALFIENRRGEEDILVISSAKDIEGDAYRSKLRSTLAIAFLLALIVMVITSIVFSRRLNGPVLKIIQKVNNINAFNLNIRLENEPNLYEIGELKDTLNDLLSRIETAFKAQQDFVNNTSHSLRTPLTIIAGEAEIALSQIDPTHKANYSLQMITQETEKLKHMINTLLELAKTGTNRNNLQWQIIRIDEVLNSVKRSINKMDDHYKLKIDYRNLPINASGLHVNCHEHLLSLAICNTILNGFKYSDNKEVRIELAFKGNYVSILITDHGIGIPEKEQDKIFTPYFRASNVGNYEGFGIGLPLTMDIIRMHRGDILVHSKEGQGTTMEIVLPVENTEPAVMN